MATHHPASQPQFSGFQSPNFTSVPDEVFDVLMPQLSGAELKVLLYIIRRTFGFKKHQDEISLRQMVYGITTKEGKVLDGGTGLHKESVTKAVANLEKLGAILCHRRQSEEKGFETTTYSLRFVPLWDFSTSPSPKNRQALVGKSDSPLVGKSDLQQTVLQETVIQQTVKQHVVGALREFGISKQAAYRIATKHADAYIQQKLDQVKWLLDNQPEAVAKNPAGYLRRAIEENFSLPKGYQSPEQRRQEAEQARRTAEKAQLARERSAQALSARDPVQPIASSELTTESAWQLALKLISERQWVTKTVFETWLADTSLLDVQDNIAYIGAANSWIVQQLERQLYTVITQALAEVLGRPIEAEFISAAEALPKSA